MTDINTNANICQYISENNKFIYKECFFEKYIFLKVGKLACI